jgi:hypothetical protein
MTERGDLTVQRPQVAGPGLGANPAVAVREPAGLLIRERVTRRADCSASGQGKDLEIIADITDQPLGRMNLC